MSETGSDGIIVAGKSGLTQAEADALFLTQAEGDTRYVNESDAVALIEANSLSAAEGDALFLTPAEGDAAYVTKVGGGKETISTVAAAGATEALDLASGNIFDVTMDANCTFTFSGSTASVGCSFTLILRQDATGSRLATWPASVDWPAGTAPTLSTGASKVDVLTFVTVDNGTTWLGFIAGQDLR